jgi:sulfatase maturation enzyme AslB (radical SAM superfamily)
MDGETLRAAVDLLLASGERDRLLWFSGGEPLLEFSSLRWAVGYAETASPAARRPRFGLSTNGLLLDDEKARFLATHRVETQISFDGLPAAQDQRGPGSFGRLDSLLLRLRRLHPRWFAERVEVAITVTAANLAVLGESVEYFLERGVRTVNVAPRVTPDPGWTGASYLELARQIGRVFTTSVRLYRRTGRVPVSLFRRPRTRVRAQASDWLCGLAGGRALAVDADGSVAGCVMLAESYQTLPAPLLSERVEALRLANVRDPGLAGRVAAFPAAVKAARLFDGRSRKHSRFGRCRRCRYRAACTICPVSIGRIPGNADPDRVPDLACGFNRVALEYLSCFPA